MPNVVEPLVSTIVDPLTKTEDVLIALFSGDATLAAYNWQRWESDVTVAQPRGYINVQSTAELVLPEPMIMRCEVVLEGKPLRGSQANTLAVLMAILSQGKLAAKLNALVGDGSIMFYDGTSERMQVSQVIERDLRVRRIVFQIAAAWQVMYV